MLRILLTTSLFAAASATALGGANLVLEDFGPAQLPVLENVRQTFQASLKNTGDTATPAKVTHAVTFYQRHADGKRVTLTYSATFKGPLEPGQSVVVTADTPWIPPAPGALALEAEADDVNRIEETDENDNTLKKELVVQPDLEARKAVAADPAPRLPPPSPMELVPNGDFTQKGADGKPLGWKDQTFRAYGPATVVDLGRNLSFEWDSRGKVFWDSEYVFSYDIKITGPEIKPGVRVALWPRLPDQHEPPGGTVYGPFQGVTGGWKRVEVPFHMPRGISRFLAFFDRPRDFSGNILITNLSLRPKNPRDLVLPDRGLFGESDLEQMLWIWSKPGFKYDGGQINRTTTLVLGGHMGRSMIEPATPTGAWFRRTLTLPENARGVQAVFVGDDSAELFVNGKSLGRNHIWQDVVRVPLPALTPGTHEILFKVSNAFGMAGLLGRVEWLNADGTRSTISTNDRWEVSEDQGQTWSPAAPVAAPAPALAAFSWVFPHLPQQEYLLVHALPEGVTGARFLGVSPNSFSLSAAGESLGDFGSAGQPVGVDLGTRLNGKTRLELAFREIGLQPPAGNGVLELQIGDSVKLVPVKDFLTPEGSAPVPSTIFVSDRTWPVSQVAFEAAATRPIVSKTYARQKWVTQLLDGLTPQWQIGVPDGSSAEFAPLDRQSGSFTTQTPSAEFPRGLELTNHRELAVSFELAEVPAHGAAFILDVEDADAVASQCGVFINGTLAGVFQLSGPDQFPGGQLTQRAWVVTIDPERLREGDNQLKLRMLAPYYEARDKEAANQSEEYIRQLDLGDRAANPYPTADWLHWDALSFYVLAKPVAAPINGRPAWLGTNAGTYDKFPIADWKDWILRDLQYMGFTGTDAPLRCGIWTESQLAGYRKKDELSGGSTRGDWIFQALLDLGIRPYPNFEPGRGIRTPEELADSSEAEVIRAYGKYFDIMEIGNEVDHPFYGFDRFALANAAATIQKQSTAGRRLSALLPDHPVRLMGEGWYHAWDFSTLDAHARQEGDSDPGYTEDLSAHSYGMSYIISSSTYQKLYGPTLGNKNIWVSECGAWTPKDDIVAPFDRNIRGNLSFASHIVQYVVHPYTSSHVRFSLLSSQDADARILEKGRCYRRYVLAYGVKGAPLPWRPLAGSLTDDSAVLVRAVDAGKWWKIALINFTNTTQPAKISVTLPIAGTFSAQKFADGITVAAATKSVTLTASPTLELNESLNAGESIEYLIAK